MQAGGFLEWAEFLGNLYGTPVPDPPPGCDVLLEIDLQGARQVLQCCAGAVLILLLPPDPAVQAQRLRSRGDGEDTIAKRLSVGTQEERSGREIADHVVVNEDLDAAVAAVLGILACHRHAADPASAGLDGGHGPRGNRPGEHLAAEKRPNEHGPDEHGPGEHRA